MSARPRGGRGRQAHAVTALFDDPADVERALASLTRAGVPRDLVDVVVSAAAARRHYPDRARGLGREAIRYAGIGGLVGLVVGAVLSLVIIILPGYAEPGLGAIAQLLGPNLATISGALIGAVIGLFVHRRAERRYARAAEAPNSIVVVVTCRTIEEERAVAGILAESGGSEPRLEEG